MLVQQGSDVSCAVWPAETCLWTFPVHPSQLLWPSVLLFEVLAAVVVVSVLASVSLDHWATDAVAPRIVVIGAAATVELEAINSTSTSVVLDS
jgi:hypothetical protein